MASPTFAEVWTQTKHPIHWLQELDELANADTDNLIGIEDALQAVLEGDFIGGMLGALQARRAAVSQLLTPAAVAALLTPALVELGKVIGSPARDVATLMRDLREYMTDSSESINASTVSLGSITTPGGTKGTLYRISVDEDGNLLTGLTHIEAKKLVCVQDQNQVDKHREVFEYRGTEAERDLLNVVGSGIVLRLQAATSQETETFLGNPTFSSFAGTTPTAGTPSTPTTTTQLTNWTLTTAANARVGIDTPTPYRDLVGVTGQWLRFTDNNKITQLIAETKRATLVPGIPYLLQVAVRRENSCDGNLKIKMGSQTRTIAMSTFTNDTWTVATWLATQNETAFYKNFQADSLEVSIELESRTTGEVVIDDVILVPYQRIDGIWYALVGGETAFLRDDEFTWADTLSARGVVEYWFCRRSGFGQLPSNTGGTETITDP